MNISCPTCGCEKAICHNCGEIVQEGAIDPKGCSVIQVAIILAILVVYLVLGVIALMWAYDRIFNHNG